MRIYRLLLVNEVANEKFEQLRAEVDDHAGGRTEGVKSSEDDEDSVGWGVEIDSEGKLLVLDYSFHQSDEEKRS